MSGRWFGIIRDAVTKTNTLGVDSDGRVTTNSAAAELQTRNGQDNQRSFDPAVYSVLTSVLKELVNIKNELINIKEGE